MQQDLKDQCLVGGARGVQALWTAKGALVVEGGAGKVEPPRPIHRPIAREIVLVLEAPHGQVAGGDLHLLDPHTPRPHRDGDHLVVLICSMLEGVLTAMELAGGIITLTHSTCIHRGLGSQHLVTSY